MPPDPPLRFIKARFTIEFQQGSSNSLETPVHLINYTENLTCNNPIHIPKDTNVNGKQTVPCRRKEEKLTANETPLWQMLCWSLLREPKSYQFYSFWGQDQSRCRASETVKKLTFEYLSSIYNGSSRSSCHTNTVSLKGLIIILFLEVRMGQEKWQNVVLLRKCSIRKMSPF